MCARPDKKYLALCTLVDEKPIRFDVALPRILVLANKGMVSILRLKRLLSDELLDDFLVFGEILPSPPYTLDILLEW